LLIGVGTLGASVILALLALTACEPALVPPGDDVSLLESFRVDAAASAAPGDYDGALVVTPGAAVGDLALALDGGGLPDLTVHSPAHTDLSALTAADVTVSVATDDFYGATALAITDADGLAWLAEPLGGQLLAPSLLGADFAHLGDTSLGELEDGDYILDVRAVAFDTDDGVVEIAPGGSATLAIDGATYRATVIAAYTATLAPGAEETDCGGRVDMMSYELLRVAAAEARAQLTRPADRVVAGAGCGGLQ
jgi:hypothetical protein